VKSVIVRSNILITGVFTVLTSLAAWLFTPGLRGMIVAVDLALFAIGCFAFIWSYFSAVQRSRTDEISVAGLFALAGGVAPRRITMVMNSCLAAQVVVGLIGAIVRSSTDGRAGSTLAFGVLVPIFGLGLNGLWSSRLGVFPLRQQ
jgi:hypothetical protein